MRTGIKGLRTGSEVVDSYHGYIIVRLPSGKYSAYGVSTTSSMALAVYFWNKSNTNANTRRFDTVQDVKNALQSKIEPLK